MKTQESLKQIGYRDDLLLPDYGFSDVLGERDGSQTVPLAAFAQEPTSYKTACFGVALTTSDDPREVEFCRALGAPMVLALRPDTNTCRLWKMMARGVPELRGEFPADVLVREITSRQEQWRPSEVLRAKNIAFPNVSPQLDFYDAGLVAAIEADVHRKLNELLSTVVAQSREIYLERHDQEPDDQTYRALFQIIFRFMSAKLLGDRKHEGEWLNPDASAVLQKVNTFYNDPFAALPTLDAPIRNRAWDTIRTAIHFQNLSVEALAYVYENTFVDITTRHTLGTHATPYEVAEYMVRALPIEKLPQDERTVFEPFCGAAPFLIAALGRLRELLPDGMNAAERHDYFVRMLAGMEMDPFAREVAFHSLILADYPNSNGWSISEEDVFASPHLTDNLRRVNIVLCNPPYGPFDSEERQKHSPSATDKAVEALSRVLQHPPKMLGFVLPRVYINGERYQEARAKIEAQYDCVDVIALPDTAFHHSSIETVMVIAYNGVQGTKRRRFVSLSASGYESFKSTRTIDWEQAVPLKFWKEVADLSSLSSVAEVHQGIQYNLSLKTDFSSLVSEVEKVGFVPGLIRVRSGFTPYVTPNFVFLNVDEKIMRRNSYLLPWNLPKVLLPAARLSRGRWVTAAVADYDGLNCTQRFHGLWPKDEAPPLEVLAAVLNGPVANAWLSRHRTGRDIQARYIKSIPIPSFSPTAEELITRYVDRYIRFQGTAEAIAILLKIDAAVLDAYGLSEEAEGELLAWFDGARRPGVPGFTGYGSAFEQARAEYRRELAHFQQVERYQALVDKTFLDSLTPQEAQEKDRLSRAIDEDNAPFYENALRGLSHGR